MSRKIVTVAQAEEFIKDIRECLAHAEEAGSEDGFVDAIEEAIEKLGVEKLVCTIDWDYDEDEVDDDFRADTYFGPRVTIE